VKATNTRQYGGVGNDKGGRRVPGRNASAGSATVRRRLPAGGQKGPGLVDQTIGSGGVCGPAPRQDGIPEASFQKEPPSSCPIGQEVGGEPVSKSFPRLFAQAAARPQDVEKQR
jgi:hypothetical protein